MTDYVRPMKTQITDEKTKKVVRQISCEYNIGSSVADFKKRQGYTEDLPVLHLVGEAIGIRMVRDLIRPMAYEKTETGEWKFGPKEIQLAVSAAKITTKFKPSGPSMRDSMLAGLRMAGTTEEMITVILAAYDKKLAAEEEAPTALEGTAEAEAQEGPQQAA